MEDDEDVFALLKTLANEDAGDGDGDGGNSGDTEMNGDEESKEDVAAPTSSQPSNLNEIAPYEDDLDYLKGIMTIILVHSKIYQFVDISNCMMSMSM